LDAWHDVDAGIQNKTGAVRARSQRDQQLAVFETIGCALATLRRLDSVWYDEDLRTTITAVRSSLSVAQSKVKERIETIVERTPA
jgi:hypothetical protein